jgi:putative PIN family toxin of toxin-antitoxin system
VRIVLDTNVFISGVFFRGPPHAVLQAWREGRVQLVVSPEILLEYREVADELAGRYPGVDVTPLTELVIVRAELVLAPPLPEAVCDDPDDDKFLACAVSAGVACVVSGDRHLLKASGYRGIEVLRPRAFVERCLES